MKTANFIKVTAVHSMPSVVNYNLQGFKTTGKWPMQPWERYNQNQLVTFHGDSARPDASRHGQGLAFIHQSAANSKYAYHYMNVIPHRNWTSGHTIIQSFDYKANPNLPPLVVHHLGNELYLRFKRYLQDTYGYHLSGGLVSTHMDQHGQRIHAGDKSYLRLRGFTKTTYVDKHNHFKHRTKIPHLHNHIVVPNYNAEGRSISKYLRAKDIYQLQRINDDITAHCSYFIRVPENAYANTKSNPFRKQLHHGIYFFEFKDYFFDKLRKKADPISEYTRHPIHVVGKHVYHKQGKSDIQKGCIAFNAANNYAWDHRYQLIELYKKKHPRKYRHVRNFVKVRWGRNLYLMKNYGLNFHLKYKDKMTHKRNPQFTLRYEFPLHHYKYPYYSMANLGILAWKNKQDMQADRFVRQLDFSSPRGKKSLYYEPITYRRYKGVMHKAAQILPSIQKINSPKARRHNRVKLNKIYQATPIASHINIIIRNRNVLNAKLLKKQSDAIKALDISRQKAKIGGLVNQIRNRKFSHYNHHYTNDLIVRNLSQEANHNMNEYPRGRKLKVAKRVTNDIRTNNGGMVHDNKGHRQTKRIRRSEGPSVN